MGSYWQRRYHSLFGGKKRSIPEMARWGLLNFSLFVLRRAGRAAPADAEPSIEATLGAMNRAEDMAEIVVCQLRSGDVF